ncbi:MAG: M23 family metallopeptidase [Pseudomonadota bacterium]
MPEARQASPWQVWLALALACIALAACTEKTPVNPPPPVVLPRAEPAQPPAVPPPVSIPPAPSPSPDVAAVESAGPVPSTLLIPVQGVAAYALQDTFTQGRDGDNRSHEALDILAPTGTPVLAADDGRIAKLFLSKPGGITIYQFDPTGQFAYYYAHLDRYAEGLAEGQMLSRGSVIGYVGSSGNANPAAPHLHFAIFRLGPEKQWWKGEPINPYSFLGGRKP